MLMFPPERIVCLTEETVETLYLLGEERRIVGVSGYAVRPPRVRKEKPRVSAFISADCAEDPRARARPRAHLLRPAGRHRRRADPPQRRGACLQPARRRRHPRHDPHARRAGRRCRRRPTRWRRRCSERLRMARERAPSAAAPPAGLFRGMGRADDLRHQLGVGADRDRGRHRGVSRRWRRSKNAKDRIVIAARGDRGSARHHRRLLVRQEIRAGEGLRARRASMRSRRCATAGCARSNRR